MIWRWPNWKRSLKNSHRVTTEQRQTIDLLQKELAQRKEAEKKGQKRPAEEPKEKDGRRMLLNWANHFSVASLIGVSFSRFITGHLEQITCYTGCWWSYFLRIHFDTQVSNKKISFFSLYIENYTTQLYGNFHEPYKPLYGCRCLFYQPVQWKVRVFFRGSLRDNQFSLFVGAPWQCQQNGKTVCMLIVMLPEIDWFVQQMFVQNQMSRQKKNWLSIILVAE